MSANLGVVALYIESQHSRVLVARDVEEALECAFSSLPDVTLLDIQMFVFHGFKTCRRLEAKSRAALSAPEDIVQGFSAGGVDYAEPPEVMARIRTDLTMREMHRRSDKGPAPIPNWHGGAAPMADWAWANVRAPWSWSCGVRAFRALV